MNEQIKPIEEYPGYFVSNLGKIYTEFRGTKRKELKPHKHKSGYLYANIYRKTDEGERTRHYLRIHRLVYSHFIGDLRDDLTINHIDHIKTNNHFSNLEQITMKENIRKYWKQRRENEKNKAR